MSAIEPVGTTLTIGSHTFCYVSLSGVGVDGGEAIDDTCLSNTTWRTKMPQTLIDTPNVTFTAVYEPADLAAIRAEVNVNQALVLDFPSPLGAITFYGYLKSFNPAEAGVGERWTGTGEIVVTNQNGGVETGPSYS